MKGRIKHGIGCQNWCSLTIIISDIPCVALTLKRGEHESSWYLWTKSMLLMQKSLCDQYQRTTRSMKSRTFWASLGGVGQRRYLRHSESWMSRKCNIGFGYIGDNKLGSWEWLAERQVFINHLVLQNGSRTSSKFSIKIYLVAGKEDGSFFRGVMGTSPYASGT